MSSDSISGIFKTISDCAQISKWAGGIGIAGHKIRAKGGQIRGTNGTSNGLVPMLRVFNETACYVDQGGESVLEASLFTSNHGMLILKISLC